MPEKISLYDYAISKSLQLSGLSGSILQNLT